MEEKNKDKLFRRHYVGGEVCKLVGTFILSELGNIIGKKNTSFQCDDGLGVQRYMNPWATNKIRKLIIKMFHENGFQFEIKTNLKKKGSSMLRSI